MGAWAQAGFNHAQSLLKILGLMEKEALVKKAAWLTIAFLGSYTLASASSVDCLTVLNTNVLGIGACSLSGLLFDQFVVNSVPSGSSIFLSAVGTGVVGDTVNLGFQITTLAPPSDTLFQYHVSTLSGTPSIMGVDNFHNGTGSVRIGELVCAKPFVGGICPAGSVLANFANPPDSLATFAAQSEVFILKDISIPTANSFISSFVNSVDLPEPATSLLAALGLFSIAGVFRKQSRRN
jgi:hypothetical protein